MKKRYINTIIVLLIILLAFSTYKIISTKEKLSIDEEMYQYLSGIKYEYKTKTEIVDDNGDITLKNKGNTVTLDSTPIYYKRKDKILLSKSMSIIFPKSNFLSNKLKKLSHINYNKKLKESDYEKNSLLINVSSGFLYDGEDLYVLLSDGIVNVGGKSINISPLSYVIANYNNSIIIYNRESDEYNEIKLDDNKAYITTNDYTINILYDSVKYEDKEQLLIKNVDILKFIDEKK